jgi:hypothetical protein
MATKKILTAGLGVMDIDGLEWAVAESVITGLDKSKIEESRELHASFVLLFRTYFFVRILLCG